MVHRLLMPVELIYSGEAFTVRAASQIAFKQLEVFLQMSSVPVRNLPKDVVNELT